MYGMEPYDIVRLAVTHEGSSHREAARRFGIDPRTVKKACTGEGRYDELLSTTRLSADEAGAPPCTGAVDGRDRLDSRR
jgi:hypothetical protein